MRGRVQIFTGLGVIVGFGGLVVWAFIEAVQAEPAIVGSVGVAVIGVLGVVWQQRQAEKARLREAQRDRMSPVYYDLLGVMVKMFRSGKEGPGPEVVEFFTDLKARQLILGAVVAWEALLLAIRKDLGHNDSDLPAGQLLRLFMTDYDEHFADE